MKPGPPPKPTALKLVQGNPGKRSLPKDEPLPDVGAPDLPDHLSADAKVEWIRIMPMLIRCRIVTEIDTAALALYCQSYGRWKVAERKIAEMREKGEDGLTIRAPSGYPVQNPYLAIANRAMDDCHKYLQAFGLSPSARTRVTVTPKGDAIGNQKTGTNYFT